jgi:PBP1b-binding outer membrane lipoprotein LpoB
MIKKVLSVMVFGIIAFSGCSQTKAEVKAPAKEVNATKVDTNTTKEVKKEVKKSVSKVNGGATHIPFSEISK